MLEKILVYPGSALIYIFVYILSIVLARQAECSKQKMPKSLIALLVMLSLFAGLRDEHVGTDTQEYYQIFRRYHGARLSELINIDDGMEIGFKIISKLLVTVWGNETIVMVTYSTLIVTLIILRLWELKKQVSFTIAILIYYSISYFIMFNTMRQWLAVALVFYGSRHIFDKSLFKYICFVLVASTFHISALLSLLMIIIYSFLKREKLTSGKILISIFLIFFSLILFEILRTIPTIAQLIKVYFNPDHSIESENSIPFTLVFFLLIEFIGIVRKHSGVDYANNTINTDFNRIIKFVYFVGLLIMAVTLFKNANRIAYYFTIFSTIYFGMHESDMNMKKIKTTAAVVLSVYSLLSNLGTGRYGIMPYSMIGF